jgi:hypothetical protein
MLVVVVDSELVMIVGEPAWRANPKTPEVLFPKTVAEYTPSNCPG